MTKRTTRQKPDNRPTEPIPYDEHATYRIAVLSGRETKPDGTEKLTFSKDYDDVTVKGKQILDTGFENTTEFFISNPWGFKGGVLYSILKLDGHNARVIETGTFNENIYADRENSPLAIHSQMMEQQGLADSFRETMTEKEQRHRAELQLRELQAQIQMKDQTNRELIERLNKTQTEGTGNESYLRQVLTDKERIIEDLRRELDRRTQEFTEARFELKEQISKLETANERMKTTIDLEKRFLKQKEEIENDQLATLQGFDLKQEERKNKTLEGILGIAAQFGPTILQLAGPAIQKGFNKLARVSPEDIQQTAATMQPAMATEPPAADSALPTQEIKDEASLYN